MKTAVVTGATSGIGLCVMKTLLEQGWRVLGIGRANERCQTAACTLPKDAAFHFFRADLMQQSEVRRAADEINAYLEEHGIEGLDALILNAGCTRSSYSTTAEGFEQQFALNYLSGVLLTRLLLPLLLKAKGSVLWTGSNSHKHARVHWEDIMLQRRYNPLIAYKQSKICGLLFSQAFNRRFIKRGVRMYVIDPGLVNTEIGCKDTGSLVRLVWNLRKRGGVPPEVPAQTYAYVLSCDPAPEGLYFYNCAQAPYSKYADDTERAERLFRLSETLCGVRFEEDDLCLR
ncbi:MAG: SDR family NAD(P)-dependent oxidoreductase [Bacillota bacterium]